MCGKNYGRNGSARIRVSNARRSGRSRRLGAAAALLLAGVFASCSLMNHPWGKADDYVAGLQCRMSDDELRNYTQQYPQLEIRDPREPELLTAGKENTKILLWVGAEGLTAYQVTWTYPLTNFDSQPKTDLCSGQKYVELNLIGDSELVGAEVWLDDERIGQLSNSGKFTWDVPLGTHELRIETAAGDSWSQSLDYDESSRGHHRLPISIVLLGAAGDGDHRKEVPMMADATKTQVAPPPLEPGWSPIQPIAP